MNQLGGSRTDTLIKLVLVFFLSLLSFSVGTFVGKQFSDSQHKIAELEGDDSKRDTASIPETKPEPNQVISEDEISKLSEEFVKKEKDDGKAPVAAAKADNSNKPSAAAIHDEITNVAKKIATGAALNPTPKEPMRQPTNFPGEVAGSAIGKFTVQVASQGSEDQAQKKVEELKGKGFSAFYVPTEVNGKKWYRVSVGQFDDRGKALKYRAKLMKEAGLESAIVQKITK